jgi:hypothetical protein
MALHAVASGSNHPENLWAGIVVAAFAAREKPSSLDDLSITKLRGDLLLTVAELNRSLFLAVRPYAEIGLPTEETRASAANAGGEALAIPSETEDEWKRVAKALRMKDATAKKTDIARAVAFETGGKFNTIRKRPWLDELMKSDLSAG